jgi:hypothetical protein
MLRVTFNRTLSDSWRNKTPSLSPTVRKLYRWSKYWGTLPWKVETRTHVLETENYLVEHCIPTDLPPPYDVDDIWEEDVILLPNIEYNGLLSIVGTWQEILGVLQREDLPIPLLPTQLTTQKPPTKHTPVPTKYSKCLIED